MEQTKTYDLVLHSHVLEHIDSPFLFLKQIAEVLSEGKLMIFSVPYLEKLLAEKAVSVLNFEHTCLLTEDFIDDLLAKTGFSVVEKKYYLNHSVIYIVKKTMLLSTTSHTTMVNHYNKYYRLFNEWLEFYTRYVDNLNKQINNNHVYFFGAHISAQFYKAFGLDFNQI